MIEIKIPMRPMSKDRPRFVNGHCYTSERTKFAEDAIGWLVKEQMVKQSLPIMNKPISMSLEFGFKLPKNMTKAERDMLKENNFQHIKKPDIDNMCKLVLDSLNKIAYVDDKLIVHLDAIKIFGGEDYIKIKIEEI